MNCSQCSNPLTPNAKFCKSCGARQTAPGREAVPAEKICAQCKALCRPQARFCHQCGAVFDAQATATPASATAPAPLTAVPPSVFSAPEIPPQTAAAERTGPPLIEPMDSMAPSPAPIVAPVFAPHHDSRPSFPQEPPRSSKTWIKWAVLALIAAAIAGGLLMANNMKSLTGTNSATSASQAGKDAVSPEDKAKADALVGPQGSNGATAAVPLNDPSTVTIASPAPVQEAPPPPTATPAPAAPVINTSPEVAPPPAPSRPVTPAPMKAPPTKKSSAPSLNDLLD